MHPARNDLAAPGFHVDLAGRRVTGQRRGKVGKVGCKKEKRCFRTEVSLKDGNSSTVHNNKKKYFKKNEARPDTSSHTTATVKT